MIKPEIVARLKPHQIEGVSRALACPRGFLFAWGTGTGKTYGALALAKQREAQHVLVICPANAKSMWRRVGREWGFGAVTWVSGSTLESRLLEEDDSPYLTIINYELLGSVPIEIIGGYDMIIADESHAIKNVGKGQLKRAPVRTRKLFELRDQNPKTYRLALSATPGADKPIDIYGQLFWLDPFRWGSFWSYAHCFHEIKKNEYGAEVGAVREDRIPRFQSLLAEVAHFVDKREVSMPPASFVVHRGVEWDLNEKSLVFTNTHNEVDRLAEFFPNAIAFYGGSKGKYRASVKKREKLIAQAIEENRSLICTMHSARESIDLTAYSRVIYPEACYALLPLLQSMGRAWRLNSPTEVRFEFYINSAFEERKMALVVQKLKAISDALPTGMNLDEYLDKKYSEAEFNRDLAAIDFDIETLDLSADF